MGCSEVVAAKASSVQDRYTNVLHGAEVILESSEVKGDQKTSNELSSKRSRRGPEAGDVPLVS